MAGNRDLCGVKGGDKGVSQYRLLQSGVDNKTLDSLKKGKNITLLTLEKLCAILDCTPNEVVEFK